MNNVDMVLARSSSSITLKGSMLTLTTIQLFHSDLGELSHQLDEKIKQAPHFFQHAPIVIDLGRLPASTMIDFQTLVYTLRSKKLIPIGIRGGSQMAKDAAIAAGLAIFPEERVPSKAEKKEGKSDMVPPPSVSLNTTPTRLVTQPVRSGQQIYVPGGDLIILAAVSHGAEVLADGHIHIHGPLRGRALAGVTGNKEAMIFCRSLEAELISIAGQYQISEDLKVKENVWKQAVCIQWQEARLNIHAV